MTLVFTHSQEHTVTLSIGGCLGLLLQVSNDGLERINLPLQGLVLFSKLCNVTWKIKRG